MFKWEKNPKVLVIWELQRAKCPEDLMVYIFRQSFLFTSNAYVSVIPLNLTLILYVIRLLVFVFQIAACL